VKIKYSIGVKTPAGWRSVSIIAQACAISEKMVTVENVLFIDNEAPGYNQSRTGAKRQQFNGLYFAQNEKGKKKRLASLKLLE
jgi:hypothetical protein